VCAPLVLEGGVQLRADAWGRHYVRANSVKCELGTLKNWRFKTRFFASFLFAFEMKSRPGQGLIVKAMKIRLKQNDHASSRTQRSPHTRREQHRPSPSPTLAASSTAQALSHTRREQHRRSPSPTLAATRTAQNPARRPGPPANALELSRLHPNRPVQTNHFAVQHRVVEYLLHQHGVLRRLAQP
jgi:hypothetical protein